MMMMIFGSFIYHVHSCVCLHSRPKHCTLSVHSLQYHSSYIYSKQRSLNTSESIKLRVEYLTDYKGHPLICCRHKQSSSLSLLNISHLVVNHILVWLIYLQSNQMFLFMKVFWAHL